MDELAFRERLREHLDEVRDQPIRWWWLSFADPKRPAGEQFLGVAIVQGLDVVTAALVAHRLGINPGGQVAGIPLDDDRIPGPEYRERLLSRRELVEGCLV